MRALFQCVCRLRQGNTFVYLTVQNHLGCAHLLHRREHGFGVEQIIGLCAAPDATEPGLVKLDLDRLVAVVQLRVEPALPKLFRVVGAVPVTTFCRPAPDTTET